MLELYNLPPERCAAPESRRAWPLATLPALLAAQAERQPDSVAIEDRESKITFAALLDDVRAVATGLGARGVRPGDVVASQLPTAYESIVLHYAVAACGAVASPISLLHREHDLRHMLALVEPRLVVARPEYRGHAYAALLQDSAAAVGLTDVVVPTSPGALLATLAGDPTRTALPHIDDPDAPLYIVWTSGTTSEPKGVIHTHNTGLCGLAAKAERVGLVADDALLFITPLAHHIGIYGMHLLALVGLRLVLQETWQAERAVEVVAAARPTFTLGTPTFLIDFLRAPNLAAHDLGSLRFFSVGGAPVPPVVVEQAASLLPQCRVLASYGTSEEGYVTSVAPEDPPSLSAESDGRPLVHMEVRVLDPQGQPLGTSAEGDLVVRTPSAFAGYARRPVQTREVLLDGGWRWTGDRAILRPDGSVRITGRSKDIIIRGGINVPVVQVESALLKHPAVGSVAVVGMPDERLGERACAYVVPRGEQAPTLDALRALLRQEGLAPTYWPERLELVDALPMTASGKVQKFRLREQVAALLESEQATT